MSAVSKSVNIDPPAAANAGCEAQCLGEQTDYPDGWFRQYALTATEASGWRFVKFTWENTKVTPSGSETLDPGEAYHTPADVAESRTETPHTFIEYQISEITAYFEYDGGSSSEDSSEDSGDSSSDDSSDDSSEEWEDGPLLYNPKTGHLRFNPLTNHLRYKRTQVSD